MGREKHAEREQKLMIWSNMPATEWDHYHLMMMPLLIVVVEYNLNCAGLNSAQIWPNAANVIGQQFKIPVGNVPRHTANAKGFWKEVIFLWASQSLNHNRAFFSVTETKVKAERPKDKQQLDSKNSARFENNFKIRVWVQGTRLDQSVHQQHLFSMWKCLNIYKKDTGWMGAYFDLKPSIRTTYQLYRHCRRIWNWEMITSWMVFLL